MILERVSKATVVISASVGVVGGAWLGARAWPPLLPMTLLLLAGGMGAGRRWGARAWIPVMVTAYILPALFLVTHGFMTFAYWMPWFAALLGVAMGNMDYRAWAFPSAWKWPLAYWALAIALVWPLIVAREADFSWALMSRYNLATSGLGGPPPVVAVWILSVALTYLVGSLWFDAAFRQFTHENGSVNLALFMQTVVWPLSVSAFVGSLVAIYQGTIDLNWLSGHQWPFYHRASGSLDDGNAFGAVAGLWVGGFLAAGAISRQRWRQLASILGACAAAAGLWMTGSRMALLIALISGAFALWFAVSARKWTRRNLAFAALSLIGMAVVAGFLATRSSTASPIERVRASLPGLTRAELRKFASFELWNRFGPFGTVSVVMVREFPLAGVGVGTFNHLFTDYAFVLTGDRAHRDNAQSWYRHQLAELGVVGSLGWLIWVPMVAVLLVRTRGDDEHRFAATMVKGALVGMGIVSVVSMPTQAVPVAFTVWVFVFWYLQLSAGAISAARAPWRASGATMARVVWLLAIVFVGATAWTGWRALRPPYRAMRADWTYQVGFGTLETPAGRPAFRWTERHAVIVVPITGPWLKLTFRGGAPDAVTPPRRVVVRRAGKVIGSALLTTAEPTTWYVKAASAHAAHARMMLEFNVTRTLRQPDGQEVGVAVDDWLFVDEPPRGAIVIR